MTVPVGASGVSAQEAGNDRGRCALPSAADRAATIARIYSAIQLYYAHPTEELYDALDERFELYVEEAMRASTRLDFTYATMRFMAWFDNGHTEAFDTCLQADRPQYPFRIVWSNDQWLIAESSLPGLEAGDVVERVDGVPIEEVYREAAPLIAASTDGDRRSRFLGRPYYDHLLPERFTLATRDGGSVVVDRNASSGDDERETTARWLREGSIAYLHVPAWNRPRFEERALELLQTYRDADALVIDLRGAGGGTSPTEFIRALMDRPWRYWATGSSLHLGYFQMWYERGFEGYRQFAYPTYVASARWDTANAVYTGPIAVLTDRHCISACEDFVFPFKDTGRGIVVGDTTGGSTGQPYSVAAPEGYRIDVQAKGQYFPRGGSVEGVGIPPDVVVLPAPEDLKRGRDPVLERAVSLLSSPP